MFSKTCEYAIRAMIYLSRSSNISTKVGVKDIAKNINAPEHFVAKILQELARKGLVQSAKGPNGGFYLDDDGLNITLAEIVQATDGDGIYKNCVLGLKTCSEKKPCPVHEEYKEIRTKITELLQSNTMADFKKKLDLGISFLKNN